MREKLDLNGIAGLNEEVEALLPGLINSLGSDKYHTAKLKIEVEFRLQPDSGLQVTYKTRQEYPPRSILARRDLIDGVRI